MERLPIYPFVYPCIYLPIYVAIYETIYVAILFPPRIRKWTVHDLLRYRVEALYLGDTRFESLPRD
jgi:hypothetical protein